jgi:hypothetical protein
MNTNMPRGAWSGSAGRKYFIIPALLILAAACSKSQPTAVQPAPVGQNQPAQNQQATSTPAVATTTPAKPAAPAAPLTLAVYNNAAQHFKILYLSYFNLYTASQVKSNKTKGVNFSACTPYGLSPELCFALNSQPYLNTNLESAAVAITILKNKTSIGDCGTFTQQELNGGQVLGSVQGNGVVFVTAKATDAGAGNFYETHFNRAFYGTICYEIDETAHWTEASNYSPPRAEFDKADVWSKLDVLRNGFGFVK